MQMLFLSGCSFETIAKWIGHSHPNVTSGAYGRIAQADLEAQLGRHATFLQHQSRECKRSEWQTLAEFLKHPYHFTESEDRTMDQGFSW